MTEKNRKSRMVYAVDTEAALPLVAAVYEALYGEPLTENARVEPQVVVAAWNKDAWAGAVDIATIDTEGVGEWLGDNNTLPLYVTIGLSQYTIPLGLHRVPLLDEPVDFAQHVRTFGSRLESNWSLWDTLMAKAVKQGVPSYHAKFVVKED